MRRWALLVLPVAGVAVLAGGARARTDAVQNGPIVYQRTNYPSAQLWEIEPDGSKNHPLTSGPLPSLMPSGSPDGRSIAYVHGGAVLVMTGEPLGRHRVTAPDFLDVFEPAWSPRGDRIAFDGTHGGKYGVYAIGWDGRHITKIYAETQRSTLSDYAYGAAWSPDARRIAFVISSSTPAKGGIRYRDELWVANADGTRARELRTIRLSSLRKGEVIHDPTHLRPAWSPDGTKIAVPITNATGTSIYFLRLDGTAPTRLTQGTGDFFPAWSPDGSRLVFSRVLPGTRRFELFTIGADGSNETQITHDTQSDLLPTWLRA